MFKIAAVVWIMLGTTLAGLALLVIVTVPQLSKDILFLLPIACGAAVVAAIPLSYLVAWRMTRAAAG
jgi:hypothetical protein